MGQSKPPSSRSRSTSPLFFIGRDSHGNWVVQDQQRRCGGLFVNRTEALKFALFENGHRPQAVVMVPGVFELDMRPFLNTRATMAVWVDADQHHRGKKLQLLLERLGFRIEAGAKCETGFVLAAERREWTPVANAA